MVNYRLANEQDYEKINSFYNRIYQSNRTIEQFFWEFHDAPFGHSIYVIAEDGDKIVGTNCVIPIDLICDNKEVVRSGKSEDTLVDPDYRGQNIFYEIYEFLFQKCKEANIQVIWGFTTAKKPFKKLGFEIPFDNEQSLAVNKIGKSYSFLSSLNSSNKSIDKLKILGLCMISKVKTIGRINSKPLAYRIDEKSEVINGVDTLIFENQIHSNSAIFAINQTPDFQDWRIYKNPNFYKVHTYSFYNEDDTLKALIIFNSHANKVAYICQSTFCPSLSEIEKVQILQHVTKKLFNSGIVLVRSWLFNTNNLNNQEIALHRSAGYSILKRGNGFVWKSLNEITISPENFYLSRIASQGVI